MLYRSKSYGDFCARVRGVPGPEAPGSFLGVAFFFEGGRGVLGKKNSLCGGRGSCMEGSLCQG